MKTKGMFGYLTLMSAGLLLLTVIGGMSSVFVSIANTWSVNQTSKIADSLAQVLWFGGVVIVAVLGYILFIAASRGGGGSRQPQNTRETQYAITDGLPTPAQPKLLTADTDADWYEIETPRQQRQLA